MPWCWDAWGVSSDQYSIHSDPRSGFQKDHLRGGFPMPGSAPGRVPAARWRALKNQGQWPGQSRRLVLTRSHSESRNAPTAASHAAPPCSIAMMRSPAATCPSSPPPPRIGVWYRRTSGAERTGMGTGSRRQRGMSPGATSGNRRDSHQDWQVLTALAILAGLIVVYEAGHFFAATWEGRGSA